VYYYVMLNDRAEGKITEENFGKILSLQVHGYTTEIMGILTFLNIK
jgi:hypothetical protein